MPSMPINTLGRCLHRCLSSPRYRLHLAILALVGSTLLAAAILRHPRALRPPGIAATPCPTGGGVLVAAPLPPHLPGGTASPVPTQPLEAYVAMRRQASARGSTELRSAPPTAVPTAKPKQVITYQVVSGDTVLALAQKYGISAETIVWANNLPNGGKDLQIGQNLIIPPVSGVLYTVKKGDTVLGIALTYGVSPESIIEANGLEDPYILSIGQQIIVPGGRRIPPPAPVPQAGGVEHRVVAGETIESIARRYGVDPAALVSANGLSDPDMIRVGQQLVIPGLKAPGARPSPQPNPTGEEAAPSPTPSASPSPAASPTSADAQPTELPQVGNKGQEITAIALRFLGSRYVWGGASPAGFDCSGFTWYVCQQAGVAIPLHDMPGQLRTGHMVKRSELLPGDLVFFQNTFKVGLSHTGIYIGGGRFIHAANQSTGVRIDSLDSAYWDVRFYGASRPW